MQICAARGIGSLFEEDGIPGELGDVDGDGEALAGEDGVCERDVLRGEGAGDGEDQDARCEGLGGGVGGVGVCGCGGGGGGVRGGEGCEETVGVG